MYYSYYPHGVENIVNPPIEMTVFGDLRAKILRSQNGTLRPENEISFNEVRP